MNMDIYYDVEEENDCTDSNGDDNSIYNEWNTSSTELMKSYSKSLHNDTLGQSMSEEFSQSSMHHGESRSYDENLFDFESGGSVYPDEDKSYEDIISTRIPNIYRNCQSNDFYEGEYSYEDNDNNDKIITNGSEEEEKWINTLKKEILREQHSEIHRNKRQSSMNRKLMFECTCSLTSSSNCMENVKYGDYDFMDSFDNKSKDNRKMKENKSRRFLDKEKGTNFLSDKDDEYKIHVRKEGTNLGYRKRVGKKESLDGSESGGKYFEDVKCKKCNTTGNIKRFKGSIQYAEKIIHGIQSPIVARGKPCSCKASFEGPNKFLYRMETIYSNGMKPVCVDSSKMFVAFGSSTGFVHIVKVNPLSRSVRQLDEPCTLVTVFKCFDSDGGKVGCKSISFITKDFLAVGGSNGNCCIFKIIKRGGGNYNQAHMREYIRRGKGAISTEMEKRSPNLSSPISNKTNSAINETSLYNNSSENACNKNNDNNNGIVDTWTDTSTNEIGEKFLKSKQSANNEPQQGDLNVNLLSNNYDVIKCATIQHDAPVVGIVPNPLNTTILFTLTSNKIMFKLDLTTQQVRQINDVSFPLTAIASLSNCKDKLICATPSGWAIILDCLTMEVLHRFQIVKHSRKMRIRIYCVNDFILFHCDDDTIRLFSSTTFSKYAKYKMVRFVNRSAGDLVPYLARIETSKYSIENVYLIICRMSGTVNVFRPFKYHPPIAVFGNKMGKPPKVVTVKPYCRFKVGERISAFVTIESYETEVLDSSRIPFKLEFSNPPDSSFTSTDLKHKSVTALVRSIKEKRKMRKEKEKESYNNIINYSTTKRRQNKKIVVSTKDARQLIFVCSKADGQIGILLLGLS